MRSASQGRYGSLSTRLVALLSIALLPLGLIAVLQTITVVREAEDLAEENILSDTADAASDALSLLRKAQGASEALGVSAYTIDQGSQACTEVMKRFVSMNEEFIFAGLIGADGVMECSSSGNRVDFSQTDTWAAYVADPRPMVTANRAGRVTQKSVLISSVPIWDDGGQLFGAMSVSIQHSFVDQLLEGRIGLVHLALVDGSGGILTASSGIDDVARIEALGLVPSEMDLLDGGAVVEALDSDGWTTQVSVVPLIEGDMYVVGLLDEASEPASVSFLGTAAPAFPILMWLASLVVAYLAIDRLVLRHLKHLRRKMVMFRLDDTESEYARLADAPSELRDIASSYNRMIDRAESSRMELESSVREKEVMLKEVHHRVKNNLQLIASILNMQMRTVDAPEALRVLHRVQDRVMSLATIHRSLYTGDEVDTVQVDGMLTEIVNGLLNVGMSHEDTIRSELRIAPVVLDVDQAVPLSLLITEAVTNAMKYVGKSESSEPWVRVHVSEDVDGMVTATIENTRGPTNIRDEMGDDGTGLGTRLIKAFVSQLGGELDLVETTDAYTVSVRFPKLATSGIAAEAAE